MWPALVVTIAMSLGVDQPTSSAPSEPISVRISPHWAGSFPVETDRTHVCPGHRIRIAMTHGYDGQRHSAQITRVTIDDMPVMPEELASINQVISGFSWAPEIYPECLNNRIRLRMQQIERGQVVENKLVELR